MKIEINSEEKIFIDCLHSINEDGIYWFEYILDASGNGWLDAVMFSIYKCLLL